MSIIHRTNLRPIWSSAMGMLGLALLLSGVAGCGPSGPEIVPVTGTLLQDGKPVGNASITFYATAGRPSYGTSDAQGRFTLEYARDVPGAEVGDHKVVITKSEMGPPPAVESLEPTAGGPAPQRNLGNQGPMEVTLSETITVSRDMGDLDLVIP